MGSLGNGRQGGRVTEGTGSDLPLLRDGIAKARAWFGGFATGEPQAGAAVAEALGEVTAALERLDAVVSKSRGEMRFAQHSANPLVQVAQTKAESFMVRFRAEQEARRRERCSLRAAFVRTRRRKLKRRYTYDPTEAVTYDVVRSERADGKVVQRFLVGLGTLKLGGREGRTAPRTIRLLRPARHPPGAVPARAGAQAPGGLRPQGRGHLAGHRRLPRRAGGG
jgi:hypothetical protein